MQYVTDFADQAVLLPLALVVAACLAISGWWRGAGAWLLGVGATLTVMLILKVGFIACSPDPILRSPSGHTAAAAVVCGSLMVVLGGNRRFALPVAFVAAVLIGGSRLELGVHSWLEVLLGATAGMGGAAMTAHFAGSAPRFQRNRLVLAAVLVVVLLHGMHMPARKRISAIWLAASPGICQPVVQADPAASSIFARRRPRRSATLWGSTEGARECR